MSALQKKLFATLFLLLLGLIGLYLPHKPLRSSPQPLKEILGDQAVNTALSEFGIEPEAGNIPVVEKINSARSSIDMTIYLLSDPDIINALIAAHRRNIAVRIILEKAPFGGGNVNKVTRAKLLEAGVPVHDPPALISLSHEKSFIIDRQELFIATFNYTKAAFANNRGFYLSNRSPPDVAEAVNIFEADWHNRLYSPTSPNLVISPDNSRAKLESLINQATTSLAIACEVLEDSEIIALINSVSQRVPTKVMLADSAKIAQNLTAAADLKAGKAEVRFLHSPYLHAKYIIVDSRFAYMGSINLTRQSLEQNRELGIIFENPDLVSQMVETFDNDWSLATSE